MLNMKHIANFGRAKCENAHTQRKLETIARHQSMTPKHQQLWIPGTEKGNAHNSPYCGKPYTNIQILLEHLEISPKQNASKPRKRPNNPNGATIIGKWEKILTKTKHAMNQTQTLGPLKQ